MSVLLPAPLPPTRPTTSPARKSTVTPSTACTPPNATRIFRISTSGGVDVMSALRVDARTHPIQLLPRGQYQRRCPASVNQLSASPCPSGVTALPLRQAPRRELCRCRPTTTYHR